MKKGKMAWDYVAVILLLLLFAIIAIIFSGKVKDTIIEGGRSFLRIIGMK